MNIKIRINNKQFKMQIINKHKKNKQMITHCRNKNNNDYIIKNMQTI